MLVDTAGLGPDVEVGGAQALPGLVEVAGRVVLQDGVPQNCVYIYLYIYIERERERDRERERMYRERERKR